MKRWVVFVIGTALGIIVGLLIADAACADDPTPFKRSQALKRQAYAIDGDTLDLDGMRIRLWGIDAPELHQTCDSQPVGQWARTRLAELLRADIVSCQSKGKDRYGRQLAVCSRGDYGQQLTDINQTMVREGLAFAYRRYTNAYAADEGGGPIQQFHCANPETVRHR